MRRVPGHPTGQVQGSSLHPWRAVGVQLKKGDCRSLSRVQVGNGRTAGLTQNIYIYCTDG